MFGNDRKNQEKTVTGKILHLDGDRKYSQKSYMYYRKFGLNAIVKNIPEHRQPYEVYRLLKIYNPDILIIDEILSVGDVKFQKKSNDKIKSLMGSGTTVLLVSHSIQQIRNLCDKALWINEGKVVAFDEVNKVCDAYLKAAENASKDQLKNIKLE